MLLGAPSRGTTAVAAPATQFVPAAPRAAFNDANFFGRWVPFEKLSVARQLDVGFLVEQGECLRQGPVAAPVMMPVGFTVCCDVHELW